MKMVLTWMVLLLAIHGAIQLYERPERLAKAEAQRKEIARLESKIVFLQNNDWALVIQNLPEIMQDELAAFNEVIKQNKEKWAAATWEKQNTSTYILKR